METINLHSFDDLINRSKDVAKKYGFNEIYTISSPGAILYRGQSDSAWGLRTTLDRNSSIKSLKKYLHFCAKLQPIIETEYEPKYSPLTKKDVTDWFKQDLTFAMANPLWYDYSAYLRHHGFPSPLLDWTQSIYVALGFAFFEESKADARAVFMYIEMPSTVKHTPIGRPQIQRLGQYVKTSRRHFLQQSMYTICYQQEDDDYSLQSYDLIKNPVAKVEQDVLVKFVIPSSEKDKILQYLFSVNITPYSVIPNEENFMKTLWLREHHLRKKEAAQQQNRGDRA